MSDEVTLDEFIEGDVSESGRVETPIGKLPSDWRVEWLNDVCDINPDGFSEDKWPSDTFEYITLSDVSGGEILQSETTPLDEAPSRAQRQIMEGDVLVGTVRPKQMSHGFVTTEHKGKICSSGFGVLRTSPAVVPHYLIQEVLSHRFFRQMEAYVAGSGYPAVTIGDLKRHRISVPPLEEQKKIASVLYNVDQAIQKSEKIRKQVRRVKKGVAQELFHTGIKDSETKDTWMGQLPNHWDIEEFSEIVAFSQNGIYKEEDDYGGNYPIIKMGDIFGGVTLEQPIAETVRLTNKEIDKYATKEGDLVFARHAQAGWGAGDCTYIPNMDETAVVESNMVQVRLDSQVEPLFYAQYFNSETGVKSIKRITTKGNIKSISQGDLMNLKIPVAPKEEQREIAEKLSGFDKQSSQSDNIINQLRRLKQGLMQDLLSGRVRTTDTNIEVLDEVA